MEVRLSFVFAFCSRNLFQAWADYVAVGGSPRDVGDVLFEALTGDSAMVVRQVELCIRALVLFKPMFCCFG